MAFTLKKIISFFLMPLSMVAVLFFIGIYFLWVKSYKKAKLFLGLTLFTFLLFALTPFSNSLLKPLESQYAKVETLNSDIEYILLLGGSFKTRGYEALRLYHEHENIKIITSGYGGYDSISDAKKAAQKLMAVGVKKEDIIIEGNSKDTHEEALMMKTKIKNRPFYLVTSALHMPRAMMLFKQEGLNPTAAPTDFIYQKNIGMLNVFNAGSALATQKAMHEYIGISYAWLKEKIYTIKGLF